MAENVVTNLVIDARGATAGTEIYVRAMNAAQAAVNRVIDANNAMEIASGKAVAGLVGGAASVGKIAQQWDKVRSASDPAIAAATRYKQKMERAAVAADSTFKRIGVNAAETSAVLAKFSEQQRRAYEAAGAPKGPVNDSRAILGMQPIAKPGSANESMSAFRQQFDQMESLAKAKGAAIGTEFQKAVNTQIAAGGKSAQNLGAVFGDADKHVLAQAAAMDALVAKYTPLRAAEAQRIQSLSEIDALRRKGRLTEEEHAAAVSKVGAVYRTTATEIQRQTQVAATGGRLMAGEMANLSFQLNDIATGIALGQSPFMILAQQGGQVYQILANSRVAIEKGLGEALRSAGRTVVDVGGSMVKWFTAGRLAATGAVGAILGIAAASEGYGKQRNEIENALTGIGRASGVTATQVMDIGKAASSAFGLSVSEGRKAATAFAATGKIYEENVRAATLVTKDLAAVTGQDVEEAAKEFAAALAEPVAGADKLNERLGFLNGRTRELIQTLTDANRIQEAQKIIIDGVAGATENASQRLTLFEKAWRAVKNIASGAGAFIEESAAALTGAGASPESQRTELQSRLGDTTRLRDAQNPDSARYRMLTAEVERLTAAISKLDEAQRAAGQSAENLRLDRHSMAADNAVKSLIPEIEQIKKLQKALADLDLARKDPTVRQRMGPSYSAELDNAAARGQLQTQMLQEQKEKTDRLTAATRELAAAYGGCSIETARRLEQTGGELLAEMEKNKGAAGTGSNQHKQVRSTETTAPPKLSDLGITKTQGGTDVGNQYRQAA